MTTSSISSTSFSATSMGRNIPTPPSSPPPLEPFSFELFSREERTTSVTRPLFEDGQGFAGFITLRTSINRMQNAFSEESQETSSSKIITTETDSEERNARIGLLFSSISTEHASTNKSEKSSFDEPKIHLSIRTDALNQWGDSELVKTPSTDTAVKEVLTPDGQQIEEPISPPFSENAVHHQVQQFIKNSDMHLLEQFPTVEEFTSELQSCKQNNQKRVVLSIKAGSDQFFFKFVQETYDKVPMCDCEVLRVSEEGWSELLPFTNYTHVKTIDKAALAFQPLFARNWESVEAFNQELKSLLANITRKEFIKDTENTFFSHFPDNSEFAKELNNLWTKRSEDMDIAIRFKKDSIEYIFKFTLEENEPIAFDCYRWDKATLQIMPEEDFIKFNTIEKAIESLIPLFSKKEESEELFFEQLKYLILTTPMILSTLESEIVLDQMRSKVKSEDSITLKEAFERLQKEKFSTELDIGGQVLDMPLAALVLYYLNIIQLNETPEVLNDDPDYALKAFQNIKGCASTPDQRTRAYLYAQTNMLFNALEMASTNRNLYQVKECLVRLDNAVKQMPSSCESQLRPLFSSFTIENDVLSLSKMREVMKETLQLP